MANSYKTYASIIDYTLCETYMFCGTNQRPHNFNGGKEMKRRIFGWLMCLSGVALLAGCAAPLLMAVPTLMTGAHMTAMVTKERGVTVTFDEKSVEAISAQKGTAPVRSLGIVSTAPHVIGVRWCGGSRC